MSATKPLQKRGKSINKGKQAFLFQIKGKQSLYLKQTISIDFTPVKAINEASSPPRISSFSIIPTFNYDNKFYSYAFITPYHGLDDDNKMLIDHETRVKEYSTQIDQPKILLPKPRNEKPYCSVCRLLYQDYLEHVQSEFHLQKLTTNKYCVLTKELADIFKTKQKQTKRSSKRLHQKRS